jgi:hypothetical protein
MGPPRELTRKQKLSYCFRVDEIRAELAALGEEARTRIDRRDDAARRARAARMKWEEIASLLGMTVPGLRKALNKRTDKS